MIHDNGIEKQIRPKTRNPGANTLLYMKFANNLNDDSGNNNSMSGSGIGYGTIGGKNYVELTATTGGITGPGNLMSSVGTGDFAVSFWLLPITSSNYPLIFANWYDGSPRPGVQMFMMYQSGWGLNNQVSYHMTQVGHGSSMSASSLSGAWHNFIFTRVSGVCYGYIDGEEAFTSWSDNTSLSNVNILKILNRPDDSGQRWDNTGIKMSELIVEKQGWSADDVSKYVSSVKDNYGL